ncbi:hypothetical protein Tco_0700940 [Tanacetum coccineum]
MGCGDPVFTIAAKRSKSGHRFGFVRFINVNDINQLVSNLRTAWMGGFHLFADVAKYGRTYNRPVERSGDGKPSVGSNSQSVSINENVFQSFKLVMLPAVLGNKSVDMSGKYGTSNAGAEFVRVSDCNKVYKEAGNEAVMSISVDDCIDLDGKERSILAKVKDLNERCVWIDLVGLPLASWAPEVYKKLGGRWESSVFTDMRIYLGVESNLGGPIEEGEIRDDSGDCGNVTTDDNEDVTPVIAPEKDSIIAPPSTPPGNDLNIAAESGSLWIDYIGPLTIDEIES